MYIHVISDDVIIVMDFLSVTECGWFTICHKVRFISSLWSRYI